MSPQDTMMKVGDLLAHPLNRKIYGEEALDVGMLESVKNLGILEPITVITMRSYDPEESADGVYRRYVISGHRRFLAAKKVGLDRVPIRYSDLNPEDKDAVERYLVEVNRQRVKTPEQVGREFKELLRLESTAAKQRQGTSTGGNKPQLRENLPQAESGKARDKAAESLGMSGRTAQKLVALIDAADVGSAGARSLLDAVNDKKKSVDRAYKELKEAA